MYNLQPLEAQIVAQGIGRLVTYQTTAIAAGTSLEVAYQPDMGGEVAVLLGVFLPDTVPDGNWYQLRGRGHIDDIRPITDTENAAFLVLDRGENAGSITVANAANPGNLTCYLLFALVRVDDLPRLLWLLGGESLYTASVIGRDR